MSGFVLYVAPDGGLRGGVEYFDCDDVLAVLGNGA